jgi:transcription elongation factor
MIDTENVSPKEEELQKIGCITDENGLLTDKTTNETLKVANKSNVIFKKGDHVKIVSSTESHLNDLPGVVLESEKGNKVKVEIDFKDVKGQFSFPKHELVLVKHDFKNGNLVYAKYGANKGRSGMIIQVLDNGTITVYDSITKNKFEAKNTDLIFSEDMELDNEENEMFKIGELVKIKNSHMACYIIESTKFIIKVVTITNEVKKISVRDVDKINLGKRITCIDGKGNPLDLENSVKVISGQYKGYKAVIKSIYGKYVFLLNHEFIRTNGIFCEIKENLELLGSELLLESSDKGRVNHRRVPNHIRDLFGKIVHITKGNWKGYNGILVNSNDKNAMIELIAKQKTIEIPFEYFVKGDVNSAKDNASENVQFNNHGFLKTPAYYENQNMME